MTRRKTFKIYRDEAEIERELVYEDLFDCEGRIHSYIDYQSQEPTKGVYEYDQSGQVIVEWEFVDEEVVSNVEYQYDDQGNVISTKQFVAGELYEEVIQEELPQGLITRKMQYGEEIERQVESRASHRFVKDFFEGKALVEKHIGEFDLKTKTHHIKVYDGNEQLIAIHKRTVNENEQLLKSEEHDHAGNLISRSAYEYKNGLLVSESLDDFQQDLYYITKNEYNDEGVLLSSETRTPSGSLLEFEKLIYNDKGQLVGESGYSRGSFNAIYGTYVNHNKYEFEHEYEESHDDAEAQ